MCDGAQTPGLCCDANPQHHDHVPLSHIVAPPPGRRAATTPNCLFKVCGRRTVCSTADNCASRYAGSLTNSLLGQRTGRPAGLDVFERRAMPDLGATAPSFHPAGCSSSAAANPSNMAALIGTCASAVEIGCACFLDRPAVTTRLLLDRKCLKPAWHRILLSL
jgi:hypothetical protein